ncbi:MAG: hypothetical protein R3293_02600 [Candidatus Promineifilaceae bacterium]|nr:hypothetical protein [Candidatus Promineifilaceae bacterium]
MNNTQSIAEIGEDAKKQSNLLKNALRGNALFSGLSGIVALLGSQYLAEFTGLGSSMLFTILGIVLILYGIDLWWVSSREQIDHRFAWAAIILDVLWVAGSAAILLSGWPALSVAGRWTVFIIAELVALFAVIQFIGLRRSTSRS